MCTAHVNGRKKKKTFDHDNAPTAHWKTQISAGQFRNTEQKKTIERKTAAEVSRSENNKCVRARSSSLHSNIHSTALNTEHNCTNSNVEKTLTKKHRIE